MEYVYIDGKMKYFSSHDQFCELVREHMGDDAALYIRGMIPAAAAESLRDRAENAEYRTNENERIADGYLEQIREAHDLVKVLSDLLNRAGFHAVRKYETDMCNIWVVVEQLRERLEY